MRATRKKKQQDQDLRKLPKDKRPAPPTGQSAPERELPFDQLSEMERAIVKALNGRGPERKDRTVTFLADLMDGDDPKLQARNSIRRLVPGGWVENRGRGVYRITERGRKRLERV